MKKLIDFFKFIRSFYYFKTSKKYIHSDDEKAFHLLSKVNDALFYNLAVYDYFIRKAFICFKLSRMDLACEIFYKAINTLKIKTENKCINQHNCEYLQEFCLTHIAIIYRHNDLSKDYEKSLQAITLLDYDISKVDKKILVNYPMENNEKWIEEAINRNLEEKELFTKYYVNDNDSIL